MTLFAAGVTWSTSAASGPTGVVAAVRGGLSATQTYPSPSGEAACCKGAPLPLPIRAVHRLAIAENHFVSAEDEVVGDDEAPLEADTVADAEEVQVAHVRQVAPHGIIASVHRRFTTARHALMALKPGAAAASRLGTAGIRRRDSGCAAAAAAAMATAVSDGMLTAAAGRRCVPRSRTPPAAPAQIPTAITPPDLLGVACTPPNRPFRHVTANAWPNSLLRHVVVERAVPYVLIVLVKGDGVARTGTGCGSEREITDEGAAKVAM